MTPDYTVDQFMDQLDQSFAFFLLVIYLTPMYRLIGFIVEEKASRAREGMKIMGLKDFPYWMSWFVYYFILITFISFLGAGILKLNVFVHTGWFVLGLFLWLYGMCLFSFGLFITTLIGKPRTAGIISVLIHFITYFLSAPVMPPGSPETLK